MTINIKEHFDKMKKEHTEMLDKALSNKEKIKEELARKATVKSKLKAEKQRKETLLLETAQEGVDVPNLKDKIQELDTQIARIDADMVVLQNEERENEGIMSRSFERENLLVSVLQRVYACSEAVVVNRVDECFKTLPVRLTQLDRAGHPKQCTISISQQRTVLNVKPCTKYFCKDFRPPSLNWLPTSDESQTIQEWEQRDFDGDEAQPLSRRAQAESDKVQVFFDAQTKMLILSQKLEWRISIKVKQEHWPHEDRDETKIMQDEFTDIAVQLGDQVKKLLPPEKPELDLENPYKDNPLLARARSEVKAQTTSKPIFKECGEHLASTEIHDRIKSEWNAFINCPWSSVIRGRLALLKYHSENAEKARFWSAEFEGHYGFRLRTRDHDWIVGRIYIPPMEDMFSGPSILKIHRSGMDYDDTASEDERDWIASLGRMYIAVWKGP